MKGFILSAGVAGLFGAMAMAPASAAPIATHGVILAPAGASDVACRTVKRTVVRNGVRRVTTTQECSRPQAQQRRRVFRNGRYYYEPMRPGLSINIR